MISLVVGLSPLARGTLVANCRMFDFFRFIPAGAGNTLMNSQSANNKSVYPRWRGEHMLCDIRVCALFGLSPLARGTHNVITSRLAISRFIPAGAGNTVSLRRETRSAPVYPRWRGEHQEGSGRVQIVRGLSPLARGTPGW